MKSRITQKEARDLKPYRFWYCEIQYLLRHEDPIFYTCGTYGRNADFYKIEHPETWRTARICTGYRPTGERYIDYDTSQKREHKARDFDFKGLTAKQTKDTLRRFIFAMLDDDKSDTNTN